MKRKRIITVSIVAAALMFSARATFAQCSGVACQLRAYSPRVARVCAPPAQVYRSRACASYGASYGGYARSYVYASTAGYWTSGQRCGVAACAPIETTAPTPCEPTTTAPRYYAQIVANACDDVKTTEPPRACAPVETTTPTPCETCGEYEPIAKENGALAFRSCPTGACPIKTATTAAARTVSRLLDALNATRARYGLAALKYDATLTTGSRTQASFCASRGALIHGSGVAEILAQNSQGIETALNQWLNSPAHRALLLSPSFTFAGVGVHVDGSGRAWCAARFR